MKMENKELQESLRELFNQIDFAYQSIYDGRIINAYRQVQGAKMRLQAIMEKLKETDELVKPVDEPPKSETQ
jgi:hypothetical protein